MSSLGDMEKDLLALSEQFTWAAGDDQARASIRARYRDLHAQWMAAKEGKVEPRRESEPVNPESLF